MSKVWIQLGRVGDLLCILPLLHKDAQDGKRWPLMVAAEYASVLEGVSYVDPIIFDGPHYEIAKAVEKAEEMGMEWHCSQTNGPKEVVAEYVYRASGRNVATTTSFEKEMWKVSGRLAEWDACYPLVFDKRSPEREARLLVDHGFKRGRQKRLILVALEGNSSPFPHKDLLMELLKGHFKDDFRVMALPQAERFYDLLVLYERAHCLVASDSAPLHLARAVPGLPVIALANDKPRLWNGSPWAPQHVAYCRYGDFLDRWKDVIAAIEDIDRASGQCVHLWNGYNHKRRFDYSAGWIPLEVSLGACGRDSHHILQDKQRNPYLKDCIRMGLQKCKGEYLMLTRPDTEFAQPAQQELKADAYYAYRINHIQDGQSFVPVIDLFCAKVEWWKAHLAEIPDYVFGPDFFWSHGLWALFKKYGAVDVTGSVYRVAGESKVMRESNPRIRHNRSLADTYINTNHIASRYPKVSEQVEVFASFHGLLKGGYNPAIVEHDDKILMAYRYHPFDQNLATKLALATVDPKDGKLLGTQPVELPDVGSMEDPKWFTYRKQLCMSWVESTVPKRPYTSVVKWSTFEHETWGAVNQPDFGSNDGTTMQKNWVCFEDGDRLAAIVSCQPYRIHCGSWFTYAENLHPKWPYGTIRGGTPPVEYEGQWLRFFHGGLDNEFGPHRRRYFVGALLMRKEPPFDVLRVSTKPVIYGSEVSDTKVSLRPFHFKPNVVFPSGVIARSDHFLLSIGVNDSESLIVKIKEKELNL